MKQGFTLIEILVVLAIIGVILMIGIPNFTRETRIRTVVQATRELARTIDQARVDAKRAGVCKVVTFPSAGTSGNTYTIRTYTYTMNTSLTPTPADIANDEIARKKALLCIPNTTTPNYTDETITVIKGAELYVPPTQTDSTIKYIPPYANNFTQNPIDLEVRSNTDATAKRKIKLTAVLGTVVFK